MKFHARQVFVFLSFFFYKEKLFFPKLKGHQEILLKTLIGITSQLRTPMKVKFYFNALYASEVFKTFIFKKFGITPIVLCKKV
jgi:hypothetical protein